MKSEISRGEMHDHLPALGSAEEDFYSILSRAVDAARVDDAQLRKAVFEILRARLQRQGWTRKPPVGISEMKEYLRAFDAAIARIENDNSKAHKVRQAQPKMSSIESSAQSKAAELPAAKAKPKDVSVVDRQEPAAAPDVAPTPLARPAERPLSPAREPSGSNVSVPIQREPRSAGDIAPKPDAPGPTTGALPLVHESTSKNVSAVIQHEPIAAQDVGPLPVFLSPAKRPFRPVREPSSKALSVLIQPQPIAAWDLDPVPVSLTLAKRPLSPVYEPRRKWSAALPVLRLTAAAILVGLLSAMLAGTRWHALSPIGEPPAVASKQPSSGLDQEADSTTPALPLPIVYGVYAISGGQLNELSALPVNVPDQRVFMSAPVTSPSRTTLSDGRLVFVAFRRDLVTSAPERVTIRVVAKVKSALSFDAAGKPKLTSLDAQWAVRGNSYEFRVAPMKNRPEMIVIRPENDGFAFPAGRYALVLKGQAYDFSIEGPITETAQCLERTEALNGAIYSECRNP
jgi:hypothetical protein